MYKTNDINRVKIDLFFFYIRKWIVQLFLITIKIQKQNMKLKVKIY